MRARGQNVRAQRRSFAEVLPRVFGTGEVPSSHFRGFPARIMTTGPLCAARISHPPGVSSHGQFTPSPLLDDLGVDVLPELRGGLEVCASAEVTQAKAVSARMSVDRVMGALP